MSQTIYLPIKLNNTLPKKTGVFISDHVNPAADINFVVYFHGHIISACQTDRPEFEEDGIEYYWDTPFFKCLRDELTAAKVNAILIAPTLGPKLGNASADSYGNLNANEKFDFLINETLAKLKEDE